MTPISKPLEEWTDDDVAALVGLRENQFLEAKGPEVDINEPAGRRKVARAVAGLASSMGGIVVIGATEEEHVVRSLPGVTVVADASRRLHAALSDLVIPLTYIRVRMFPAPDGNSEAMILAVSVPPDPGGRPVMVQRMGFFVRTHDATVSMAYPDIETRMRLSEDGTARASSEAEERAQLRPTNLSKDEIPMTLVSVPVFSTGDVGRSGSDLRDVWWEVTRHAVDTWERVDRVMANRMKQLPQPVITGHGLTGENSDIRFEVDHRGRAAAAFPIEALRDDHFPDYPSPFRISASLVHAATVFLAFQRRLGVAGPVLLRIGSGQIAGTSTTTSDSRLMTSMTADLPFQLEVPAREIRLESFVPIWGETNIAAKQSLMTFLTRLADNARSPGSSPAFREEAEFMERMLPPFKEDP